MEEIELKLCPFCKNPGEIEYIAVCERPYFPHCSNEQCIASDLGRSFETEDEAAEAWNERAGEDGVEE